MKVSDSVLTPDRVAQIRSELERTLARIERSIRTNGNGQSREIDQSAVGRLSRIEALQNQGLTQNLQEREQLKLREVSEALQRLDEGSFGVCSDCNAPIQFERLLVFPEARTCCGCSGSH